MKTQTYFRLKFSKFKGFFSFLGLTVELQFNWIDYNKKKKVFSLASSLQKKKTTKIYEKKINVLNINLLMCHWINSK